MASLKVDSESYPRCLWYSVTGSLIGAFQFGYAIAVLNTALPFIAKDLHYHKDAYLSSAVVLGAAFGALVSGKAADCLGPRHAQGVNCLAFMVGALLAGGATSHRSFILGRVVAGFGAGSASLYVPRYIAEVSPPGLRGGLGSMNQVLITAGILAAYCAGLPYEQGFKGFDVFGGNVWLSWWRAMNGLALLPAILQVLVLSGCPESPVWLEGQGRRTAADEACIRLWGARAILADPDYEADAARAADLVTSASIGRSANLGRTMILQSEITTPLLLAGGSASSGPGFMAQPSSRVYDEDGSGVLRSSALGSPQIAGSSADQVQGFTGSAAEGLEGSQGLFAHRYRLMMALAVGLPLLQQASGINTVVYYSSKVFAHAGVSSPIAASIITGAVNLGVALLAAALLDRCGRKPLLLLSHLGMAATLAAVAALSIATTGAISSVLLVVLLLLYVSCFAAGSGPVAWVVLSEVLPSHIKGAAAAAATAAGWAGNLAVTLSFPPLLQHLGLAGTYCLYCLLNLGAVLYVWLLLVETKGRSLQEIEQLLLLPDDNQRRRAALRPTPQQQQSDSSSTAAAAAAAAGGPSYVYTAPQWYRPAAAAAVLGYRPTAAAAAAAGVGGVIPPILHHQQQQQQLVQQQSTAAAATMSPFSAVPAAAAAAAHVPRAAAAAGFSSGNAMSFHHHHHQHHHDDSDLDLPSALPDTNTFDSYQHQEDVMLIKQHYVAGWAQDAAQQAAAVEHDGAAAAGGGGHTHVAGANNAAVAAWAADATQPAAAAASLGQQQHATAAAAAAAAVSDEGQAGRHTHTGTAAGSKDDTAAAGHASHGHMQQEQQQAAPTEQPQQQQQRDALQKVAPYDSQHSSSSSSSSPAAPAVGTSAAVGAARSAAPPPVVVVKGFVVTQHHHHHHQQIQPVLHDGCWEKG